MHKISYTMTLLSDAEPGTGFSTETLNSIAPRNHKGVPIIPASQIKGILRHNLLQMANDLEKGNLEDFVRKVLGKAGGDPAGEESLVFFSNAEATQSKANVHTITRTSLNEFGTAQDTSLRTTEAISAGLKLKGHLYCRFAPNSQPDLLMRLGLLSLHAIGSQRNRGCGQIRVTIEGEKRSPGQLLKELLDGDLDWSARPLAKPRDVSQFSASSTGFYELSFQAESPLCLPEKPIVGTNAIETGIAIPASAVQGAILHRINRMDSALADACFASPEFRTWPLLPLPGEDAGIPVRVSLTHKISKVPIEKNSEYKFADEILGSLPWDQLPHNAPLKGVDGVLVPTQKSLLLWKAGMMGRVLSAHGVHASAEQGRNLYSVESLAPLTFRGIVALPADAAKLLAASIQADDFFQFGKARSRLGGGRLQIQPLEDADRLSQGKLPKKYKNRAFIAQSPLLLPEEMANGMTHDLLAQLVKASCGIATEDAYASIRLLFGWNRHGKVQGTGYGKRARAVRVIAPGSVFLLKEPVEDLLSFLKEGVGQGRERGLGSVLPHPGIAESQYPREADVQIQKIASKSQSGILGYRLHAKAKSSGLTASQIAYLASRFQAGKDKGFAYLENICKTRPDRIWNRWEGMMNEIEKIANEHPLEECVGALRVWQTLVAAEADD